MPQAASLFPFFVGNDIERKIQWHNRLVFKKYANC